MPVAEQTRLGTIWISVTEETDERISAFAMFPTDPDFSEGDFDCPVTAPSWEKFMEKVEIIANRICGGNNGLKLEIE